MRLNKYIAAHTGLSRRAADAAVAAGNVRVNNLLPSSGQDVSDEDVITLNGEVIQTDVKILTYMLHKPVGYVCSRNGQGSKEIYDLLPETLHHLKPVGRLDKDSSGLLLLTNDGDLAHALTHPSFQKVKVYEVLLNQELQPLHHQMICDYGVQLEDGPSKLQLEKMNNALHWRVTMHEGRNRQIRRTFDALGYNVRGLHRTNFGSYSLGNLGVGKIKKLDG